MEGASKEEEVTGTWHSRSGREGTSFFFHFLSSFLISYVWYTCIFFFFITAFRGGKSRFIVSTKDVATRTGEMRLSEGDPPTSYPVVMIPV